jgi:predicted nucleic acid-binding Zn ribbon protein
MSTILIILLVIFVFGGGGFYWTRARSVGTNKDIEGEIT